MLELRKDGVTIPIPPELEVNREFETTIFNRDSDATDFTLPVDLPLTDDLLRILDMPHVLANPNVKQEYDFELIIDGIYINKVILRVLRTKLRQKTCSVSIIGNYGSFAKVAGDIKVNELTLGGVRQIGNQLPSSQNEVLFSHSSGGYQQVVYQGVDTGTYLANNINANYQQTDFLFPTCVDELANLTYIHDSLKTDEPVRSIINGYDWTGTGSYINPVKHYINSVFKNDFWSSERHFWVPMFRLGFVLKKCFEELGFAVSGSIFQDANFMNILLYNTYSINKVIKAFTNALPPLQSGGPSALLLIDASYFVDPKNHVPKMSITEFISEVAKNYNLQFVVDFNAQSVIVNKLSTVGSTKDLSDYVFPDPEINFEKTEFMNGYEFSFDSDPSDGASGADIEDDVDTYTYRGAVNTVADLVTISSPAAFDIAYVRGLNAFYQFGGMDWFFYSHNLGKYKTSNSDQLQKLSTKLVPMPLKTIDYTLQKVFNNVNTPVPIVNRVIGVYSEMGMEGNGLIGINLGLMNTGLLPVSLPSVSVFYDMFVYVNNNLPPTYPHLGISHGFQQELSNAGYYPMMSSMPYSAKGTSISGYGQAWSNPEDKGLYPDWWQGFVERLANALQVDYKVLMNPIIYSTLDLNSDVILIENLRYLCRKATIPMPFPSVATLTLVRV